MIHVVEDVVGLERGILLDSIIFGEAHYPRNLGISLIWRKASDATRQEWKREEIVREWAIPWLRHESGCRRRRRRDRLRKWSINWSRNWS
jgi:hypothetical protein